MTIKKLESQLLQACRQVNMMNKRQEGTAYEQVEMALA